MIIGLTGGIGSGKTTVSRMLHGLGAEIIDADEIARAIVVPGEPAYHALIKEFGDAILNPDHTLNRAHLAKLAFSSPERTQALNRITHPEIRLRIASAIASASDQGVIVIDAPLLFEAKMEDDVDEVWVVFAGETDQIERLRAREGCTEQQAQARMAAQMPLADKVDRAHIVIDNRGTIDQTRRQVQAQYRRITGGTAE